MAGAGFTEEKDHLEWWGFAWRKCRVVGGDPQKEPVKTEA